MPNVLECNRIAGIRGPVAPRPRSLYFDFDHYAGSPTARGEAADRRNIMNGAKHVLAITSLLLTALPAHAYIGPGSGLSAVGALLALGAALIVAFIGFVWYPIRRMRRNRRERSATNDLVPPRGGSRARDTASLSGD